MPATAAASARISTATTCSCCRRRAPPLVDRQAARPAPAARRAAQDPGALRARAELRARARRHALPAAALCARRRGRGRRLHDLLDRPALAGGRAARRRPAGAHRRGACRSCCRTRPARAAVHYRDPTQPALANAGRDAAALQAFAREAVLAAAARRRCHRSRPRRVDDRAQADGLVRCTARRPTRWSDVALDRRTRMLYDARHLYINGESFRAGGRDATLMRKLADQRALGPRDLRRGQRGCARPAERLVRSGVAACRMTRLDGRPARGRLRRPPRPFDAHLQRRARPPRRAQNWREIVPVATPTSSTGRWASARPSRPLQALVGGGPQPRAAGAALRRLRARTRTLRALAPHVEPHHRCPGLRTVRACRRCPSAHLDAGLVPASRRRRTRARHLRARRPSAASLARAHRRMPARMRGRPFRPARWACKPKPRIAPRQRARDGGAGLEFFRPDLHPRSFPMKKSACLIASLIGCRRADGLRKEGGAAPAVVAPPPALVRLRPLRRAVHPHRRRRRRPMLQSALDAANAATEAAKKSADDATGQAAEGRPHCVRQAKSRPRAAFFLQRVGPQRRSSQGEPSACRGREHLVGAARPAPRPSPAPHDVGPVVLLAQVRRHHVAQAVVQHRARDARRRRCSTGARSCRRRAA